MAEINNLDEFFDGVEEFRKTNPEKWEILKSKKVSFENFMTLKALLEWWTKEEISRIIAESAKNKAWNVSQ